MLGQNAKKQFNKTPHPMCVGYTGFSAAFGLYPVTYSSVTFQQLQVLQRYASRKIFEGEIIYV